MVVGRARLGVGYSLQGAFLVFRFLCTFLYFLLCYDEVYLQGCDAVLLERVCA